MENSMWKTKETLCENNEYTERRRSEKKISWKIKVLFVIEPGCSDGNSLREESEFFSGNNIVREGQTCVVSFQFKICKIKRK